MHCVPPHLSVIIKTKSRQYFHRRFGPNVSEISDEFNQLAIEFKNASLLEYAGLSFQNAAECEHIIGLLFICSSSNDTWTGHKLLNVCCRKLLCRN